MGAFLASYTFRCVVFPLGGMLFRIFVGSQQKSSPLTREDFTVGLHVMCDALLMFAALALERAVQVTKTIASLSTIADPVKLSELRGHTDVLVNEVVWAGGMIFLVFWVLFGLTALVRWSAYKHGGHPSLLVGTIVPNIAGFLSLATVAWYFSSY
jgi:hypothetical protein